jgi:hypothetical protein
MLRKILFCLVVTGIAFLFAEDANGIFTYSDYQLNNRAAMTLSQQTSDPVSLGMGSTDILNSSGASALFCNPANMGFASRTKVNAVLKVNFGSQYDEYKKYNAQLDNQDITFDPKIKITQAAIIMPIDLIGNMKLAFAGGWHVKNDLAYKKKFTNFQDYTIEENHHGGLNVLSLGSAFSIFKIWSIGASYNTNLLSSSKVDLSYEDSQIDETIYNPEGNVSGSFIKVGSTLDFANQFTAAISYQTPYKLEYEEENKQIIDQIGNPDFDINIPGEFGAGFTYYHDYFNFTTEYRTKSLSEIKMNDINVRKAANNGFGLRFGIEFNTIFPTRLGFRYETERFFDDKKVGGTYYFSDEPNYLYGFSGGFSLPLDRYSFVDVALEYSTIQWHDTQIANNLDSTLHNFVLLVGIDLGL